MKLRTALSAGLTNKMCKRTDPARMGGDPPITFVPTPPATAKEEGEEPSQVKITISSEVSKYYTVFKEGTAEDVVNLICVHEGIMTDKKLKESCNATLSRFSSKKKHLTALNNKSSCTSDKKREVKDLQEALKEYKTQIKMVQEEAYDFFEKLLDPKLVTKWQMARDCETRM